MGVKQAWSEVRLHRWLAARGKAPGLAGSAGHDAAVLRALRGRPVLCVDQCVEGIHARLGVAPRRLGRKAAARALSDLAATAATPRAVLASLTAPPERAERWLRETLRGVDEEARRHGAALVGGDLCCAPGPAELAVTALGEIDGSRRPPGRDRARPGQVVVATGPVGGSGLGRHLTFAPRLAEGRWLFDHGATAMMDVSDGLALDLSRVARASGVRIDLEHVPAHADARRAARASGRGAEAHALFDGEDHELIATLSPAALRRALAEAPRRCPGLVRIGRVRSGRGLYLPVPGRVGELRRWNGVGGWVHGAHGRERG
jgi:thiamine-monophosphate kinase